MWAIFISLLGMCCVLMRMRMDKMQQQILILSESLLKVAEVVKGQALDKLNDDIVKLASQIKKVKEETDE